MKKPNETSCSPGGLINFFLKNFQFDVTMSYRATDRTSNDGITGTYKIERQQKKSIKKLIRL